MDTVQVCYGARVALRDVQLQLEQGRIGLLGPSGAGKSTLLKTLLGLVRPAHGTVRVLGFDVARQSAEVRARVGYMPEGDNVFADLNALDFARLSGELSGLPASEATARAHQMLAFAGLGEARYRSLAGFSTGMRQRARLAQALVGSPELLLLDEPTSGLDPAGRDEMLALIESIPERTGASVILSTHILPDVERTCDQVIVLSGAQVKYAGALQPLLQQEAGVFEVRIKQDLQRAVDCLQRVSCQATPEGTALHVRVPPGEGAGLILRTLVSEGLQVRHLSPLTQTLEQAFRRTVLDGPAESASP